MLNYSNESKKGKKTNREKMELCKSKSISVSTLLRNYEISPENDILFNVRDVEKEKYI